MLLRKGANLGDRNLCGQDGKRVSVGSPHRWMMPEKAFALSELLSTTDKSRLTSPSTLGSTSPSTSRPFVWNPLQLNSTLPPPQLTRFLPHRRVRHAWRLWPCSGLHIQEEEDYWAHLLPEPGSHYAAQTRPWTQDPLVLASWIPRISYEPLHLASKHIY